MSRLSIKSLEETSDLVAKAAQIVAQASDVAHKSFVSLSFIAYIQLSVGIVCLGLGSNRLESPFRLIHVNIPFMWSTTSLKTCVSIRRLTHFRLDGVNKRVNCVSLRAHDDRLHLLDVAVQSARHISHLLPQVYKVTLLIGNYL